MALLAVAIQENSSVTELNLRCAQNLKKRRKTEIEERKFADKQMVKSLSGAKWLTRRSEKLIKL